MTSFDRELKILSVLSLDNVVVKLLDIAQNPNETVDSRLGAIKTTYFILDRIYSTPALGKLRRQVERYEKEVYG